MMVSLALFTAVLAPSPKADLSRSVPPLEVVPAPRSDLQAQHDWEQIVHYTRLAELEHIIERARAQKQAEVEDRAQTLRRQEMERFRYVCALVRAMTSGRRPSAEAWTRSYALTPMPEEVPVPRRVYDSARRKLADDPGVDLAERLDVIAEAIREARQ